MRIGKKKHLMTWSVVPVVILLAFLIPGSVHAEKRLTNANGNSWHSFVRTDAFGNVHILWQDDRDGNDEIYYTKLDNSGNTLVDDIRLTDNSALSSWPIFVIDNAGNIHAIWRDLRDGLAEVYYTKLDNNGNTLIDDTRLTIGSNTSGGYDLVRDNSDNLHIVWVDYRGDDPEVYYMKLDDDGNVIVPAVQVTYATGDRAWPNLGIDAADNIHLVWYDAREGAPDIYYKKLDNTGNTIIDDTRLTFSGIACGAPIVDVDTASDVHVIWADSGIDHPRLLYTKLDNTGNTLIDEVLMPQISLNGYFMDVEAGHMHIVWANDRYSINDEIYYAEYDLNDNIVISDMHITRDPGASWWPGIGVDNSAAIHIVWDDDRDGNREIYYCGVECLPACGDANSDFSVNIGDVVYTIDYMFKYGTAPEPYCVGDINDDNAVNIGDAVYLINYIFKGGPAPVEDCCQ